MGGQMTKSNHNLFVTSEETTTVTALDGTKFIAQQSQVIENGKLKQFKRGGDMYSSPTHGQQLMFSQHDEYDSTKEKEEQTEAATKRNKKSEVKDKGRGEMQGKKVPSSHSSMVKDI